MPSHVAIIVVQPVHLWCTILRKLISLFFVIKRLKKQFPYEIRRRSTYNHLSSWLTDARNLTNPNTVIFLIGNKSDLDSQRDVTYDEAKQFADENGLMFIETSAKTGDGVEEAFLETARRIFSNIQDGSLDLNAAESGVQHKPSPVLSSTNANGRQDGSGNRSDCQC